MKLFTWGANNHGQLANGCTEDVFTPNEMEITEGNLKLGKIISITGGGGFVEFLSDDGELFVCGKNQSGQLGVGHQNSLHFLQKVEWSNLNSEKVVKISCGWDHTLSLTDKGRLFVWGSNARHQLGIEDTTFLNKPTKLDLPWVIKDIAAGLTHSLAVTESGEVLSWGTGRRGQLGLNNVTVNKFPVIVSNFKEKIEKVFAGAYHSAALSENSCVYAWGSNSHGQLACDPKIVKQSAEPLLISRKSVDKLSTGWSHLILITKNSKSVYTWGRNDYYQLGINSESFWKPMKLDFKLTNVSIGSEHNLGVNEDGKLVGWGFNEHGVCGTGSETTCLATPTLIAALKNYEIHCFGTNYGSCYVIVQ
ncbi:hypothetical protein CHUAL_001058 [Chamberlinius hualienensis]